MFYTVKVEKISFMNKKKTIAITIVLLVAISFLGIAQSRGWINWLDKKMDTAQDGREELKKLYGHYMGEKANFDISGTIFLYDMEHNNALKEQAAYRNIKSGNNLFTQMAWQKTYVLDSLVVQLDTVNKIIIVSTINADFLPANNESPFPFEKFLADTSDFKITATVTDKGAERILKLRNELMPEIKTVFIYYNPVDYTISKTEIEWWKEQGVTEKADEKKCWLSRINYIHSPASSFNIANEIAKIITVKGQIAEPTEKYKDYEITVRLGDNF